MFIRIIISSTSNPPQRNSETFVGRSTGTDTKIIVYVYYEFTYTDKYIICSVNKLLELFGKRCLIGSCTSQIEVDYKIVGCCVQVYGCCTSGHQLDRASSDFHLNQNNSKIYDSNLSLVAAIILSGSNFAKLDNCFKFMGMPMVSRTTFYSYQCHFICPAVNKF